MKNPVVLRTRLLSKLDAIEPGELTLVMSGPGFGKSTLLAQWHEWSDRSVCLVRLDETDNSADALGAAVTRALIGRLPGAEGILELARKPGTDWACDILPRLTDLARNASVILVLDDVHEIREPSARDLLRGLARTWPAPNALVLAGRERPAIGLLRSTLGAPLKVIGDAELNLDEDEIRRLLALAQVDAATVAPDDLLERTGGWPAGVGFALAAVDLDAGGAAGEASSTASRFLDEHIMSSFGPDEVEFLELVAAIAPASTELVNLTLNRNDTKEILQALLARGLPMVTVDKAQVVRVHTLLSDLLRERMRESRPEQMHALLTRAAHTAISLGDIALGLTLLHRNGDLEDLARTLYLAAPVLLESRQSTLRSWVQQFPREMAATDPRLLLTSLFGMQPMFERDIRRITAQVEKGDQALLPGGGTPMAVTRRMMVALGFDPAAEVDGPQNVHWTEGRGLAMAFELYAANRFDDARTELMTLAKGGPERPLAKGQRLAILGILALESGQIGEATAHIEGARQLMESIPNHASLMTLIIDAATVRMARQAGRWTMAKNAAMVVLVKQASLGDAKQLWQCWASIELANLSLDLGEAPEIARRLRDDATRRLASWHDTSRIRKLLAELSHRIVTAPAGDSTVTTPARRGANLTTAELRLLRYLPSHYSLPKIATQLHVASSTVKSQSISVYRKLGVNGREDAVHAALELGLLADGRANNRHEFESTLEPAADR